MILFLAHDLNRGLEKESSIKMFFGWAPINGNPIDLDCENNFKKRTYLSFLYPAFPE
ncbi:MAG: hypothetical protein RIR51_1173 [Bacteroidota bacterium]|jgi:hypothetical protein